MMGGQLDLFGGHEPEIRTPTPARRTDPDTSHEAADSLDPLTLRPVHRWLLDRLALGDLISAHARCDEGLRDAFINQTELSASSSGLRTRRSELVHAGLVRDSLDRVTMRTGRRAIVWELTEQGIEAL